MQKQYSSRGLIGLLLAGLVFLLVACGPGTSNQSGATATPGRSSTTTISNRSGTTATPSRPSTASTPTAPAMPAQEQIVIFTSGAKEEGAPVTLSALRASDGTLLWHYTTQGGAVSGLKIVDGVVYVGTYRGNVYAFRIGDGKLLWQAHFDGILEWLDVVNGVVYLNTVAYAASALTAQPFFALFALRAADGSSLWKRLNSFPATDYVRSQVVLSDGVVYATMNVSPVNATGSGNQQVMVSLSAFSANDGHSIWNYSLLDNTALFAPLVTNSIVYVSAQRFDQNNALVPGAGMVYAVQQSSGSLLWKYSDNVVSYFDLQTVNNGTLYVEGGTIEPPGADEIDYVYALRTSDGSQLWRDQLTDTTLSNRINSSTQLSVLNNTVYVAETDVATNASLGRVFALQADSGKVLWRYDITGRAHSDVQVLVADDMVYVGQNENMVSALRPSDGTVLWHYQIAERGSGALKLATSKGTVYVGGIGGGSTICAIQASNGTQLWCHRADDEVIILVQIN